MALAAAATPAPEASRGRGGSSRGAGQKLSIKRQRIDGGRGHGGAVHGKKKRPSASVKVSVKNSEQQQPRARKRRPKKKKKEAAESSSLLSMPAMAVGTVQRQMKGMPRLVLDGLNLDEELERFAAYVALSPREKQLRERVFEDLRSVICSAFGDATVALYGSSCSGLDTFRSDLDISVGHQGDVSSNDRTSHSELTGSNKDVVVTELDDEDETDPPADASDDDSASFSLNLSLPTVNSTAQQAGAVALPPAPRTKSHWNPVLRRQKVRDLRALQSVIKLHRPHMRVKCLPKAKVPILMVRDPKSQLDIDVGLNREVFAASEHGRSTSLAVRLQQVLGRPFVVVVTFLKEFLHQFELDKPFTGGLGSFRLYVMVASVFSTKQRNQPERVSDLLLRFLELFGNRKHPKFFHAQTQLSLVMDPSCVVDFSGVFRLDDCVETFAMAYDILSKSQTLAAVIYEDRLARDRHAKLQQAVVAEANASTN